VGAVGRPRRSLTPGAGPRIQWIDDERDVSVRSRRHAAGQSASRASALARAWSQPTSVAMSLAARACATDSSCGPILGWARSVWARARCVRATWNGAEKRGEWSARCLGEPGRRGGRVGRRRAIRGGARRRRPGVSWYRSSGRRMGAAAGGAHRSRRGRRASRLLRPSCSTGRDTTGLEGGQSVPPCQARGALEHRPNGRLRRPQVGPKWSVGSFRVSGPWPGGKPTTRGWQVGGERPSPSFQRAATSECSSAHAARARDP
jgi:hypothetical protein